MILIAPLGSPAEIVNFPGGSVDKFIRVMTQHRIGPVAMFADPNERIRSCLGLSKANLDPKFIAKETGTVSYGSTLAFSSRELPPGFLLRPLYENYSRSCGILAKPTVKEGKITIPDTRSGSSWIKMEDLARLKLKHAISMHWTYASAIVAVTPGTFDEANLLRTLGDALGAKSSIDATTAKFMFDPKAHRTRAFARYADQAWSPSDLPTFNWGRNIYTAAARHVSDDQWATAFETPTSSVVVSHISGSSPVMKAQWQGMRAMCADLLRERQFASYETTAKALRGFNVKSEGRLEVRSTGVILSAFTTDGGHDWFYFG